MNKCILDASALLALLNCEEGSDKVEELLSFSVMSTVNVAEVIAELDKKLEISPAEDREMILTSINKIVPLDLEQSIEIGSLRRRTEKFGLSLIQMYPGQGARSDSYYNR